MKRLLYISLCFLLLISCSKGKNNPKSCNGESTRRDIKLAVDSQANQIDTIPVVVNIDSIGSVQLITAHGDTPRQDIEKKMFKVTAKVEKVSKHKDGDYKVKLVSENENYLNCEFPNLGCSYAKNSRFYNQMNIAREFMDANHKDLEDKTVTITGVGFIDLDHKYPRNTSKNEIELHPVIKIEF